METKQIAVLAYHKIGDYPPDGWPTWSYVPSDVFEEQLKAIKKSQWKVLSHEEFISGMSDTSTLPEKCILITFDDGYLSNLTIALPLLQKYNFPAVMFVPTNYIGNYNAFDADIFYEPKEQICDWDQLRQLEKAGVSIQSHGVNHLHFSQISDSEMETEIVQSKEQLEKHLQKQIDSFSFSYGDSGVNHPKTSALLAKHGYKCAFLYTGGSVILPADDLFQLTRVPIGPDTDLKQLLALSTRY